MRSGESTSDQFARLLIGDVEDPSLPLPIVLGAYNSLKLFKDIVKELKKATGGAEKLELESALGHVVRYMKIQDIMDCTYAKRYKIIGQCGVPDVAEDIREYWAHNEPTDKPMETVEVMGTISERDLFVLVKDALPDSSALKLASEFLCHGKISRDHYKTLFSTLMKDGHDEYALSEMKNVRFISLWDAVSIMEDAFYYGAMKSAKFLYRNYSKYLSLGDRQEIVRKCFCGHTSWAPDKFADLIQLLFSSPGSEFKVDEWAERVWRHTNLKYKNREMMLAATGGISYPTEYACPIFG